MKPNLKKTACLAFSLQPPAGTDVLLYLPHVWKRTKLNGVRDINEV